MKHGNTGRSRAKSESCFVRNEFLSVVQDVKEIRQRSANGQLIEDIEDRMPHRSRQFIREALSGVGVGAVVNF
tara:strand:- start:2673 stop:2891 length:219 start_codon:yes stop_codon:yes gene_type:complete